MVLRLWGLKAALLGKSPLAVSARRSSTSQVTAKGDTPSNAWAPCVSHPRSLPYISTRRLVLPARASSEFFHVRGFAYL
jgi:hypothetical protein